jgi:ATP/maltotriose-dependent transcriptional regulator MalT
VPVADLLSAGAGVLEFERDSRYGAEGGQAAPRWPMSLETGEAFEAGRSHIIERPRLTRLLDENTTRIILLVAPAGYGKTTLAREWLSTRPHAWYRGTSATADVAALAHGLVKAAATVVPGAGERMETRLRVSNAPTEEVEALAELLAEDLRDWPADSWLAFDDYQFACDSEPAERFVEHLGSSCPVRLLVSGRSRPSWATARRLLYGEIYEIGRSQLAMSQDEARSVLAKRSFDETDGLIALADGWPALIGLAALSTELETPTDSIPEELYTFFAEELYQGAPLEVQQGLRRLSLAQSVTADIAEALMEHHATEVIRQGAELGFLLTRSRERMELHPLLRSFLASKFRRKKDDPSGRLVEQLAQALMDREEWDEVFELATHFQDDGLLVRLFEVALPRMLDQARFPTIARWIGAASVREVESPLVDLAEAELALRKGEPERSEALASQAARHFRDDHPLRSRALWVAGTGAHLILRDETALEQFEAAEQAACSDRDARQALWGQFIATDSLDREREAEALLASFVELSGSTVDELLRIATGRFRMAALVAHIGATLESNRSLALLVDRSRDPLIQSSFLNSYAWLLVINGRYDDALNTARSEMTVADRYFLEFVTPLAHLHVAEANWGLRSFRACKASLMYCERAATKADDMFMASNVAALHARLHLAANAPNEALRVLDHWHHAALSCPMHAEHLGWQSLAHAVADEPSVASNLAGRARSMSRRIEVVGLLPWTEAVIAARSRRSARTAAEDAFQIALETGNIDAFVTAYRACPELLQILAKNEANHDHLKTILGRARDHALAQSAGLRLPSAPEQPGPTVLTKREREVLELVTQGLTNKEIGRVLFITEGTAKVHVRKIRQKLGARTRTDAAVRAAELSS